MSNETKSKIKILYSKLVEQALKGNPIVIIGVAIIIFWAYENIIIPGKEKLEMVFALGVGNTTYTSLVEADVKALESKLLKMEETMNAVLDARRSGEIGITEH